MRTLEHFPKDSICPICGNNDDKLCVLLPMAGTENDNICEALPVHLECIKPTLYRSNRGGNHAFISQSFSDKYYPEGK